MIDRVPILFQAFYNKRGDLFVIFDDQDSHSSNLPEFLRLRERHHVHGVMRMGVWASPEVGPDRRMSRSSSLPSCGQIGLVRLIGLYVVGAPNTPIRRFAHTPIRPFAKKRPYGFLTVRASLLPLHATPLSRSLPVQQHNDCHSDSKP
jgi:hypothetical protein